MSDEELIKIYVGTDPYMKKAEIALEESILANTKSPFEIIWMDYSRGGEWAEWNIGRERGLPYSKQGWATDFSCYRFAIPEMNGFEGRAIYLDVDMILVKDIKEFFNTPMGSPVLITSKGFDVMLYDCEEFADEDWWPSLEEMKSSGWNVNQYGGLLIEHHMLGQLSLKWNCCDGIDYDPDMTGLIHFTDMRTQPWKPYPDSFEYPPHPNPEMVAIWQKYYEAGLRRRKL